jgi:hypothetical protein
MGLRVFLEILRRLGTAVDVAGQIDVEVLRASSSDALKMTI